MCSACYNQRRAQEHGVDVVCQNPACLLVFKAMDPERLYCSKRCRLLHKPLREKRQADCHPERPHKCKGLCATCYQALKRASKPGLKDRERDYAREYMRNRRETEPERVREIRNGHYHRNAVEINAKVKTIHRARPWLGRSRTHPLTEAECEQMFAEQGEACDTCRRPLALDAQSVKDRPHIDHDHETGLVRAILCGPCNTALGLVKDTPEILRRMADYLEIHKARRSA